MLFVEELWNLIGVGGRSDRTQPQPAVRMSGAIHRGWKYPAAAVSVIRPLRGRSSAARGDQDVQALGGRSVERNGQRSHPRELELARNYFCRNMLRLTGRIWRAAIKANRSRSTGGVETLERGISWASKHEEGSALVEEERTDLRGCDDRSGFW